jgi:Domain of unknown function (DUF4396)
LWRSTSAPPRISLLKPGFLLLTAYAGGIDAFHHVLGSRETLLGLHEGYVTIRWRQTLASTMHCVAGDGVGILVGAVISSVAGLTGFAEVILEEVILEEVILEEVILEEVILEEVILEEAILEYVPGFVFGWTIFQPCSCATRPDAPISADQHIRTPNCCR